MELETRHVLRCIVTFNRPHGPWFQSLKSFYLVEELTAHLLASVFRDVA